MKTTFTTLLATLAILSLATNAQALSCNAPPSPQNMPAFQAHYDKLKQDSDWTAQVEVMSVAVADRVDLHALRPTSTVSVRVHYLHAYKPAIYDHLFDETLQVQVQGKPADLPIGTHLYLFVRSEPLTQTLGKSQIKSQTNLPTNPRFLATYGQRWVAADACEQRTFFMGTSQTPMVTQQSALHERAPYNFDSRENHEALNTGKAPLVTLHIPNNDFAAFTNFNWLTASFIHDYPEAIRPLWLKKAPQAHSLSIRSSTVPIYKASRYDNGFKEYNVPASEPITSVPKGYFAVTLSTDHMNAGYYTFVLHDNFAGYKPIAPISVQALRSGPPQHHIIRLERKTADELHAQSCTAQHSLRSAFEGNMLIPKHPDFGDATINLGEHTLFVQSTTTADKAQHESTVPVLFSNKLLKSRYGLEGVPYLQRARVNRAQWFYTGAMPTPASALEDGVVLNADPKALFYNFAGPTMETDDSWLPTSQNFVNNFIPQGTTFFAAATANHRPSDTWASLNDRGGSPSAEMPGNKGFKLDLPALNRPDKRVHHDIFRQYTGGTGVEKASIQTVHCAAWVEVKNGLLQWRDAPPESVADYIKHRQARQSVGAPPRLTQDYQNKGPYHPSSHRSWTQAALALDLTGWPGEVAMPHHTQFSYEQKSKYWDWLHVQKVAPAETTPAAAPKATP